MIFAETIANPGLTVTDIEKMSEIAHNHGVPLVVDNTTATPYLIRVLKHGADIVVNSSSKIYEWKQQCNQRDFDRWRKI